MWKIILTNILHHSHKNFSIRNTELIKQKVLLLAPTGVATMNIDGTTIHFAPHTIAGNVGKHLPALNNKTRSMLRNQFFEV